MSARSEGVFDITFEAMHGLWKFDQDLEEKIPDKAEVEAARKLIDWPQDPGRSRRAHGEAREAGHAHEPRRHRQGLRGRRRRERAPGRGRHVVLRAGRRRPLRARAGSPTAPAYRVGVRDPRGADRADYFAMLEVEDHAFSTAGDYERGFVKDGRRYHHIIDPRTGYPATASRSVTIWAKDAFTADAIDDAVFILGPEKGLALVDSIDDAGAVIVDAHNKVWVSERLKDKLHMLRPPTDGT